MYKQQLEPNTNFTIPEISRGKKWYIHFQFQSPGTTNSIRVRKKGNLNSITDLVQRELAAAKLAEHYLEKLKNKWSPITNTIDDTLIDNTPPKATTIIECINEAMKHKKNVIKWFKPFENNINLFKNWLAVNKLTLVPPDQITHSTIFKALNDIQLSRNLSARTRNNHLADISALFTTIIDMGYLSVNPCKNITQLIARSTQHKAYTQRELEKFKVWLDKNDPYLGLFIKFIMMGIRREEIVQLQVGDIDVEKGIILVPSKKGKTNKRKIKVIFRKWLPIFQNLNLEEYPSGFYFFTSSGLPGPKKTTGDFFTRKFRKLKKHFKLDRSYTMYGFRHTIVIELVKARADIKDIMNITGHDSIEAFQKYAQQYLDEPPKDISEKLAFDF